MTVSQNALLGALRRILSRCANPSYHLLVRGRIVRFIDWMRAAQSRHFK